MTQPIRLNLGVKTDPVEYRYSHEWLFRLMADEGVTHVQLGTHFEMYQLPDDYYHALRKSADDAGVTLDSMFTAHRELGGFFRIEPGFEQVARRNFERYIQVGSILGVKSVGSNPGALLRDQMGYKAKGIACYIKHFKELMHFAKECGVEWLTIEPMSCLAEPPTLPIEVREMGEDLVDYQRNHADGTARVGYCADIAHGYLDQHGQLGFDHIQLFEATIPYLYEVHLKNTDNRYSATFGFSAEERIKGIIDVGLFRKLLLKNSDRLPVSEMVGYLEIGGPKLGRDYSDFHLEQSLRDSLRYLKQSFLAGEIEPNSPSIARSATRANSRRALISPSMMCVDQLNFESCLRRVEQLGVDMLHIDIMDGKFVPNMPLGLSVLESLCGKTHLPVDVHLMVEDNDFFIELIKDFGVHQISVHVESCTHLDRTLARIREVGAKAGAAINPATPLDAIEYVLERIDYVLVMTVNPGYAGQKLTPASIRKIGDCRQWLDAQGYASLPIQVDGNVSFENIPKMIDAGAGNLVAGTSSIFHQSASWSDNMRKIIELVI